MEFMSYIAWNVLIGDPDEEESNQSFGGKYSEGICCNLYTFYDEVYNVYHRKLRVFSNTYMFWR